MCKNGRKAEKGGHGILYWWWWNNFSMESIFSYLFTMMSKKCRLVLKMKLNSSCALPSSLVDIFLYSSKRTIGIDIASICDPYKTKPMQPCDMGEWVHNHMGDWCTKLATGNCLMETKAKKQEGGLSLYSRCRAKLPSYFLRNSIL